VRPVSATTTLARHWIPERSFLSDLGLVAGFSLFTGLIAHVAIPLPFTPVPITGQTFAVLGAATVVPAGWRLSRTR
jgi:biotin transporter BioY